MTPSLLDHDTNISNQESSRLKIDIETCWRINTTIQTTSTTWNLIKQVNKISIACTRQRWTKKAEKQTKCECLTSGRSSTIYLNDSPVGDHPLCIELLNGISWREIKTCHSKNKLWIQAEGWYPTCIPCRLIKSLCTTSTTACSMQSLCMPSTTSTSQANESSSLVPHQPWSHLFFNFVLGKSWTPHNTASLTPVYKTILLLMERNTRVLLATSVYNITLTIRMSFHRFRYLEVDFYLLTADLRKCFQR